MDSWPASAGEAIALQQRLRDRVVRHDQLGPVRFVAGLDVGFEDRDRVVRAAVAVLSFPDLRMADQAVARRPVRFPYIPGLLSFREAPALLDALDKLGQRPDLLLCDGQGLAHPRRFGLACHLGVLTGLPSIGVAKSLLVGVHGPLPEPKGSWVALKDGVAPRSPHPHSLSRREREASRGTPQVRSEIIGAVLRTRAGVNPVYVSIGHRVSLATAIDYVLRCTPRYRLPETTRLAHRLASG